MGIAFFAVSGSAYGIEESVAAGGPFLALLALLLAPVLWSAPMLMVVSELAVAMPQSGGYIVWVSSAFGALPSMLNGMSNLLCNVLDCALYPVMLTDYLQRAVPALRPGVGADGAAEEASLPVAALCFVLRLALVGLAAGLNIAGVNLVGHAAGGFMLLVSVPFVALALGAAASPDFTPSTLFDASPALWPADRDGWYFLGTLVLWNTCGYDSAGMVAAEVGEPRATFPRALWGALGLTTALYVVPLAACAAASSDWREWDEGQFARLAYQFGGGGLAAALEAGAVVSMVAVLCTLMLTTSRALAAMGALRMLPARLAQLHPTLGTPVHAVVANAVMVGLAASALRFDLLMELSMFFYAVNALMQLAAALRLRASHPHLPRPERTLPLAGFAPPALLATLVLAAAPPRHWAAAATLLGATLCAYALLHACRRGMRGRRALRRLQSPSGRQLLAAAADGGGGGGAGDDADDDAQFDEQLAREMRRVSGGVVGGGTSHIALHGGGGGGAMAGLELTSFLSLFGRSGTGGGGANSDERISAAEIVSAFEVEDDGRASPGDERWQSLDASGAAPPDAAGKASGAGVDANGAGGGAAAAAAPPPPADAAPPLGPLWAPAAPAANPGRRFPSPPQRQQSAQTMRALQAAAARGEVQTACALADSLFAEGRGESV
eukprot:Transcript_17015.p1 GENE.Transcript_17015~~Transcript_17015.p1  ORF type:complete len:668 (-),score=283.06 Transcript_17015:649-2652(-)